MIVSTPPGQQCESAELGYVQTDVMITGTITCTAGSHFVYTTGTAELEASWASRAS